MTDHGAAATADSRRRGAVVIPAHDEAATIGRVLSALGCGTGAAFEVIVVCNACTDRTADVARGFPDVRVLEIDRASKPAALNAGDAVATGWPRLYLDADVAAPAAVVSDLFASLSGDGGVLAVRPPYVYDLSGASLLSRSYFRARQRLPEIGVPLWGAGAYALSEAGHARIGSFPEYLGDDLYVSSAFADGEKRVCATAPVVVRPPLTVRALVRTSRRTVRGNREQWTSPGATAAPTTRATVLGLVRAARGPLSAFDAVTYAAVAAIARAAARVGTGHGWDRDETSRGGAVGAPAPR